MIKIVNRITNNVFGLTRIFFLTNVLNHALSFNIYYYTFGVYRLLLIIALHVFALFHVYV